MRTHPKFRKALIRSDKSNVRLRNKKDPNPTGPADLTLSNKSNESGSAQISGSVTSERSESSKSTQRHRSSVSSPVRLPGPRSKCPDFPSVKLTEVSPVPKETRNDPKIIQAVVQKPVPPNAKAVPPQPKTVNIVQMSQTPQIMKVAPPPPKVSSPAPVAKKEDKATKKESKVKKKFGCCGARR